MYGFFQSELAGEMCEMFCVRCFLISTLMIDTMNPMSAVHHLRTENEFVTAIAATHLLSYFHLRGEDSFLSCNTLRSSASLSPSHTLTPCFTLVCISLERRLSEH
jgi:hypothetical protein